MTASGHVYLVGAGPGDPELLTLKAVRIIAAAEAIVYDRLVSDAILDHAPAGATRINVGKQPNHHPVPQDEINDLLVRLAKRGRKVVRLKGGDPLIFGRGCEETAHLRRHNIEYSIVPGITAAQGVAASLNLPLTHRGIANSVRYVTGHCRDNGELDYDWHGLADPSTTLVIYMGAANIARFATELQAQGRSAATPVAAVCSATHPKERRLFSTLGEMTAMTEKAEFAGPVLFIIGEVVSLCRVREKQGEQDALAHLAAAAL